MSDESVRAALRSDSKLVIIEAPAGCGKTFQGAEYAKDAVLINGYPRSLVLTHTHAACSVFSDRTKGCDARGDIRTIDSVIAQIAAAYHAGLGLPADIALWIRQRGEVGYSEVARKVVTLLQRHPMIAKSIAGRYPIVICDEHQDSSGDQHALVMTLLNEGARIRIFADPVQKIFKDRKTRGALPPFNWSELSNQADAFEQLSTPHRWSLGCKELGKWTLTAREALRNGKTINLRQNLPDSVRVAFAENIARKNFEYQLSSIERKSIDHFEKNQTSLLILTRYNDTAKSLRSFFNRRIPLWEGHTRDNLEKLTDNLCKNECNAVALAEYVVEFMGSVGKGFSPTAFGNRLVKEVNEQCKKSCRGKPAKIQHLAQFLVNEPNHRGVSKMLRKLSELTSADSDFADVKIDCYKEFYEAIKLGDFETVDDGLAEITHRRTYTRPKPLDRAISNIHKAKGLECESVIVMPCDEKSFPNKEDARCLLYVALSRAKSRLLLVVPRNSPSPLVSI